jgi:hypothetical protein
MRIWTWASGSSLDHLPAASIEYRIASGSHTGRKALILCRLPPTEENSDIPLLAGRSRNPIQPATSNQFR